MAKAPVRTRKRVNINEFKDRNTLPTEGGSSREAASESDERATSTNGWSCEA